MNLRIIHNQKIINSEPCTFTQQQFRRHSSQEQTEAKGFALREKKKATGIQRRVLSNAPQRVKHICNVWMSCHRAALQGL